MNVSTKLNFKVNMFSFDAKLYLDNLFISFFRKLQGSLSAFFICYLQTCARIL